MATGVERRRRDILALAGGVAFNAVSRLWPESPCEEAAVGGIRPTARRPPGRHSCASQNLYSPSIATDVWLLLTSVMLGLRRKKLPPALS